MTVLAMRCRAIGRMVHLDLTVNVVVETVRVLFVSMYL